MKATEKKNCNRCRKDGLFNSCDVLNNNKEYMKIKEEEKGDFFATGAFEFKDNYVCDKFDSMFIEYPIEVSKIKTNNKIEGIRDAEIGRFTKVRPCGKEYEGKTYLGIYLGDLPIGNQISHNKLTGELSVAFETNPANFVFGLNKIIFGNASWWGIIKTEEELKNITDKDIENVWYVKALKQLQK